jgi:hypothetical protein
MCMIPFLNRDVNRPFDLRRSQVYKFVSLIIVGEAVVGEADVIVSEGHFTLAI